MDGRMDGYLCVKWMDGWIPQCEYDGCVKKLMDGWMVV